MHPAWGWVIESKETSQGTLLLEWPGLPRDTVHDQEQKVEAARVEMLKIMKAHDFTDMVALSSGQNPTAPATGEGGKDSVQRRYAEAKANYERELITLTQMKEAAAARAVEKFKSPGDGK